MGLNEYSRYEREYTNPYREEHDRKKNSAFGSMLSWGANDNILNQNTYFNTLKNYGSNPVPPAIASLSTPTKVGNGTATPSTVGQGTSGTVSNQQEGSDEKASTVINGGKEETGGKGSETAIDAFIAAMQAMGSSSSTGGMSYGDYLKTYGTDTEKAYSQMVRQANSDYYRALMTYGKNAEALGGAGLVGAGVSDYGNAAAYAARQGAVATAGAAKMETDAKQAASYAEYLQNLKAQQEAERKAAVNERNNYMLTLMSTGVDRATALGMLESSGYFSDDPEAKNAAIEVLNSHYDNVDKKTVETANAENAEAISAAQSEFNSYVSAGYDAEAAFELVKGSGKFDETTLNSVWTAHQNATAISIKRNVDTALASSEYSIATEGGYVTKSQLDGLVAGGQLEEDSEEYNNYLAQIQEKNASSLIGFMKDIHNEYKDDDVCEAFGIAYDYDAPDEARKAAVKAIRERAAEMYENGDISKEAYYDALEQDFGYELDAIIDEGGFEVMREVCGSILEINGRAGDGESYERLISTAADELNAGGQLAKKIVKEIAAGLIKNYSIIKTFSDVKSGIDDIIAVFRGDFKNYSTVKNINAISAVFGGITRDNVKNIKFTGYSDEQMTVLYDIMTYGNKQKGE